MVVADAAIPGRPFKMQRHEIPASVLRRSPELIMARVAMLQEGLGRREVAKILGRAPQSITTWLSKGFPDSASRWQFEAAMGYRHPIWSGTWQLALRKSCLATHGFDPFLIQRPVLRHHALSFGLKCGRDDALPAIRERVMQWLAAHPNHPRIDPSHEPKHS